MFCWPSFGFDRWLSSHATLRSREKIKCDKTRRDSDLFTRKTDLSISSMDLGLEGTQRVNFGFALPSFGFDCKLSYHATLRSSENKKCDKTRRNSDLSGRKTDISLLSVDLDATKNKLNFSQFVNTHDHENRITTVFETTSFQS